MRPEKTCESAGSSTMLRYLLAFTLILVFAAIRSLDAQTPNSGEVTVQLIQGLDSTRNPKGMSQGMVKNSTNPAVPRGSRALMRLASDPINGGYTVQLFMLDIGGQKVSVASSNVELAPDLMNKMMERTRDPRAPKDAVSGNRVFLPEKMIVRFTLIEPPAPPVPTSAPTARTPVNAADPNVVPTPVASVKSEVTIAKWSEKLASPITKDVKAACEAPDAEHQAYCYGVLLAYYDRDLLDADADGYVPTVCMAPTTTAGQLRDAFLDQTQKEPDQLLGPMAIFYYVAMNTHFPCPKVASKPKRVPAKKR